ncbi:MAG: hypothetical protein QM589_03380 [Thermomicrobiales bacterium]
MIASLDGLNSAYARRYTFEDEFDGHLEAPPISAPEDRDHGMTAATITILQFATEADAENAWKLTAGSLMAGAIIGERPADLTATNLPDLGDDGTIYLMSDAAGSETEASGILFMRDGTTGIIVAGTGETSNAALGKRLQKFAGFALDHKATSSQVAVIAEGMAEGGAFDRMPGRDDEDVLRGLVPMGDYDLMVSDEPIQSGPAPACGCTDPSPAT